jgi:hypothetical protein
MIAQTECNESDTTARATYRYLRAGMVVIIVMLFAAILIDSIPDNFQSSISAYYYTPARNVFVAALCCLGIMLIVYKGSRDVEDVLLNLAGSLAFFVAFVPVRLPGDSCPQFFHSTNERCAAIANNISALSIGLIAAVSIIVLVYVIDPKSRAETTCWGNWLRAASAVILVGFIAAFLFRPELFDAAAHYAAAVSIFVIIGVVVFLNAYLVGKQEKPIDEKQDGYRWAYQNRYRVIYGLIGASMVGTLLGAFASAAKGIPLFALETTLLFEFAVFWAVQTFELWNYCDRNELIPEREQRKLDGI